MSAAAYWPWWAGSLLLGSVTVVFPALTGRFLGVSSVWAKLVDWRQDSAMRAAEADIAAMDPAALEAEMLAATHAQFGAGVDTTPSAPSAPPIAGNLKVRPAPWENLLFITMIAVGGALSAFLAGRFAVRFDMGADFDHLLASGWHQIPILLLGGMIVGMGTRMAGGCTSGHGLSGCSRFRPDSLVATVIFFGAGVGISLLLRALAS